MKIVLVSMMSFLSMVVCAVEIPASVSVSFNTGAAIIEGAEWLRDVKAEGGSSIDSRNGWIAGSELGWGNGRLALSIDTKMLKSDLAMTLVFEESQDLDFIIQLLDADGRVVALDLFANVAQITKTLKTDTLVLPLWKYPSASRIVIRRLNGKLILHGVLLVPVVAPLPADDPLTVLQMARLLGDPLSSQNPVVQMLRRSAPEAKLTEQVAASSTPQRRFFQEDHPEDLIEIISILNRITLRGLEFNADCFVRLASTGEVELVKLYLKAGMPVTARASSGVHAGITAAESGQLRMLDFLIENGMPVSCPDLNGMTPLKAAQKAEQSKVVKYLKMRGAMN